MPEDQRERLRGIRTFPSLVKYLHDELDWPITPDDFEDHTFEYTAEELGIDSKNAAKIQEIKRLRPLTANQPWGIFFVKFEPKRLPVVALRRILNQVVLKKRASANSVERAAWELDDLLFVSNYGDEDERKISFAHFKQEEEKYLPSLKVLGWDNLDTALHLDHLAYQLKEKLHWPSDEDNAEKWREDWRSAFTVAHREVITTSRALAIRLAELARAIRDRTRSVLEVETEEGPVTKLMDAFKESLIHDLDEDDFADMYAQTITYGLLSARIANPDGDIETDKSSNHLPVTNPFLRELMETFLHTGTGKVQKSNTAIDFDELGVSEVVDLLDNANMEAVVRDFGDQNPQEDPVIHFYELFLKQYDADKRMQRGVFYTPRPVVSFIVRSVDELLKTKFGLEDGLADTTTWGEMAKRFDDLKIPEGTPPEQAFVQILDPATGTGTFLVEVIDVIYNTMKEKWENIYGPLLADVDKRWNEYVPKHLLPRLYGYELLMAPYAIAHMKIGLKLIETGYRFESDERVRVYLTNALEPALDFSGTLDFAIPALAHEAEAVNAIKRHQQFTLIIGNPPYSKSSANRSQEAETLVHKYKKLVSNERNVQPLSDDYIKFLALSESILLRSRVGLMSMITNRGYLPGIIHRGMRSSLVDSFSHILIIDCHGDTNIGETPPLGKANENLFDIQQGVAICSFIREPIVSQQHFQHGDLWGSREEKYSFLLCNSISSSTRELSTIPRQPMFSFQINENKYAEEYKSQLKISEVFGSGNNSADRGVRYGNGIKSNRDALLIGFTLDEVETRMNLLADKRFPDEEIRRRLGLVDGPYWNTTREREKVRSVQSTNMIKPILYRPFDFRWIWYQKNLIQIGRGGASPKLMRQMLIGSNLALLTSRNSQAGSFSAVFCTNLISEMKTAESTRASYCFPLFIYASQEGIFQNKSVNLSPAFMQLLTENLLLQHSDSVSNTLNTDGHFEPREVFGYIYAQLHSKIYRVRYAEFLREDFPRVFLTQKLELFRILSLLGSNLIELHLMDSPMLNDYITTVIGTGEFLIEKVTYSDQTVWINKAKTKGFKGVPEEVWNLRIGGYQVCHKWLKDRKAKGGKNPRPGRILSDGDIEHYQKIVVALSETIRIMKEIDEVIEEHGGWPGAFHIASE